MSDLQKVVSKAADLQARSDWQVEHGYNIQPMFTDQVITVTSPAWFTLDDLTQPVLDDHYKFKVELAYTCAGAVGNARFGLTAPAFGLGRLLFLSYGSLAGVDPNPLFRLDATSGFGTSQAAVVNASPGNFLVTYEGYASFTTTGSFTVRVNKNTAADSNFTIKDSSWSEVIRLT